MKVDPKFEVDVFVSNLQSVFVEVFNIIVQYDILLSNYNSSR